MKQIAIIVIMMTLSNKSNAQIELEYFFSEEVEKALSEYVDSFAGKEQVTDFYLILYRKASDRYTINVGRKRESSKERLENLLNLTNRYAIVGGNKLPILLRTDFEFGVFGRTDQGIKRWALISEGYSIAIDGNGKIIE